MISISIYKRTGIILLLLMIFGCSAPKPKDDVWDLYDIRHPVPADSQIPISANEYNEYIDDDIYYSPPGAYQIDPD